MCANHMSCVCLHSGKFEQPMKSFLVLLAVRLTNRLLQSGQVLLLLATYFHMSRARSRIVVKAFLVRCTRFSTLTGRSFIKLLYSAYLFGLYFL